MAVALGKPAETPFVKMLRNYSSVRSFFADSGNELEKEI
jgi:hypothetical protein